MKEILRDRKYGLRISLTNRQYRNKGYLAAGRNYEVTKIIADTV
jgi:hypothetical protein